MGSPAEGRGVTVPRPAGLWGHGGFHSFQTWGNPPGHCMEKSPCALPLRGSLGGHMAPSPTPGQRFLALGKNLLRKCPRDPGTRIVGERTGGSRTYRAPSLPRESCREPWEQAHPQGVAQPLNPPEPVGVSPSSYLLPLLTSPQLDESSQEKGQNPVAAGAAPHGGVRGAGAP